MWFATYNDRKGLISSNTTLFTERCLEVVDGTTVFGATRIVYKTKNFRCMYRRLIHQVQIWLEVLVLFASSAACHSQSSNTEESNCGLKQSESLFAAPLNRSSVFFLFFRSHKVNTRINSNLLTRPLGFLGFYISGDFEKEPVHCQPLSMPLAISNPFFSTGA